MCGFYTWIGSYNQTLNGSRYRQTVDVHMQATILELLEKENSLQQVRQGLYVVAKGRLPDKSSELRAIRTMRYGYVGLGTCSLELKYAA